MTTTILIGRGPAWAGIRHVIEDLAALGLTNDALLMDYDAGMERASRVTALGLKDGRPFVTATTCEQALRGSRDDVYCAFVNCYDDPAGTIDPASWVRFRETLPISQVTPINILAARAPAPGVPGVDIADPPLMDGILNVLLAPENASDPDSGGRVFVRGDHSSDEDYYRHVAVTVASVVGLWVGISADQSPIRRKPLAGQKLQLVRCYYHRVSAADVQAEVRRRRFDTTTNPQPTVQLPDGSRSVVDVVEVTHIADFSARGADEFLERWSSLLLPKEHATTIASAHNVSANEATANFFTSYLSAVFSHPARWMRGLAGHTREVTDASAQSALYGVTGTSTTVGSMGRYDGHNFDGSSYQPLPAPPTRADVVEQLREFFLAYANLSMTMVDALPRVIDPAHGTGGAQARRPAVMEPSGRQAPPMISHSAQDVIPAPATHFGRGGRVPSHVLRQLSRDRVAPYDLPAVREAKEKLADPRYEKARRELDSCEQRHAGSLACHLADRLASMADQADKDAIVWEKRYHDVLKRTSEEPEKSAWARFFQWTGWVAMLSLICFVIVVIVGHMLSTPLTLAENFWSMTTGAKVGYLGVWFLLWLISFLLQMLSQTLHEFRAAHRRLERDAEIASARNNFIRARDASLRLRYARPQFVAVSDLMGCIINDPFGRLTERDAPCTEPANELPDSVVFAHSAPDIATIERFSDQLRSEVFTEGWLTDQLNQAITEAYQEDKAGNGQHNAEVEPQQYFPHLVGITSDHDNRAEIDRIITILSSKEFCAKDRSEDEWADTVTLLHRKPEAELDEILTPYRYATTDRAYQEKSLTGRETHGSFRTEILSDAGRIGGAATVETGVLIHGDVGDDVLGSSAVLVQFSRPFVPSQALVSSESMHGEMDSAAADPWDSTGDALEWHPGDTDPAATDAAPPAGFGLPPTPPPPQQRAPGSSTRWVDPELDGLI